MILIFYNLPGGGHSKSCGRVEVGYKDRPKNRQRLVDLLWRKTELSPKWQLLKISLSYGGLFICANCYTNICILTDWTGLLTRIYIVLDISKFV